MTDSAFRINPRVTTQRLPTPLRSARLALQQVPVMSFAHSVRVLWADVNEFTGNSEELLHHVGLARATSERLIPQNQLLVYGIAIPRRSRNKEPFTLPAKRRVFPSIS